MTLVVLHSQTTGWEAWIEGLPEALQVATVTDLNDQIRDLHLHSTTLIGARPCADFTPCPYAATTAVLSAEHDRYVLGQFCGTHAPELAPPGACLIPAVIDRPATVWRRRDGGEVTDLVRAVILHDTDPAVFAQPACRNCRKHVMPGPFPGLSWTDVDGGGRCGKRAAHIVADGEPAAVITGWALEVRARMADDDGEEAEVFSIASGVPIAS